MAEKKKPKRPKATAADPAADLVSAAARARQQVKTVQLRPDERTTLEMKRPGRRTLGDQTPDQLGELLVSQGLITRHQLFDALNESYRTGHSLKDALIELGFVDEEILARTVSPEG